MALTPTTPFLQSNGAIVNIEPGYITKPNGAVIRGAVAAKDIAVGDVLVALPMKLVLTEGVARMSKISKVTLLKQMIILHRSFLLLLLCYTYRCSTAL